MCVEHEPCRALLFEALYRRLRLSMLDGTELFAILRRFWYVNVEYVSVRSIPHPTAVFITDAAAQIIIQHYSTTVKYPTSI